MSGNEYIRISEAAKILQVTPQTIRRYKNDGKLTGYVTPGGQTLYSRKEIMQILTQNNPQYDDQKYQITAHYIRSSNGNKTLLNSQQMQLEEKYGKPDILINDKASGLNEKRKGLQKLIELSKAGKIDRVIVTQKDRLTRFGYSYLEELFKAYDVELIVAFEEEDKSLQEELMQDFMSLIASFSGKFYRLRGYKQQHMLLSDAEKRINEKEKSK